MTNQNRAAYLRAMERLNPTQTPLEVAAAHFAEAHHRLGGRSIIEAVNFFVRRHPLETPRKTVSEIYEEML